MSISQNFVFEVYRVFFLNMLSHLLKLNQPCSGLLNLYWGNISPCADCTRAAARPKFWATQIFLGNKRNLGKFVLTCFMSSYDKILCRLEYFHFMCRSMCTISDLHDFSTQFRKYLDNLSEVFGQMAHCPPPPPPLAKSCPYTYVSNPTNFLRSCTYCMQTYEIKDFLQSSK